jgi:HD-like signal output (HDOD) protein
MILAAPACRITVTREIILAHARSLPASPQVLAGLCELLQDINTGLDQISAEIRLEAALAARVIRISNSPVFGNGRRIGSVDEAVNRVGFGEVLRLVGAATVAGLVDRSLSCYSVPADRLREALLFHALASEALAEAAAVDSRMAYSAGLLRAIGMMVLDREGRSKMDASNAFDLRKFERYTGWEALRFGMMSTEVTAMILNEWRFPPMIVDALQAHLLLDEASYRNRLACVLNLAGAIVAEYGLALPGEAACWKFSEEKCAAAGITVEQFQSASANAFSLFEKQRSAL